MVGADVPLHLLERAGKPLCVWDLVSGQAHQSDIRIIMSYKVRLNLAGPIVFLCILAKSKPVTVAAAAVSKLSIAIAVTALNKSCTCIPGYNG